MTARNVTATTTMRALESADGSTNPDRVDFDVRGACCRIFFDPGCCVGLDDEDYRPGIAFSFVSTLQLHLFGNGTFGHGVGVIARNDAARLRDMLDKFLAEHPPATKETK